MRSKLVALALTTALAAMPALAGDGTWIGPVGGTATWGTGGNWSGSVPQAAGDTATFQDVAIVAGTPLIVNNSSNWTLGRLRFLSSTDVGYLDTLTIGGGGTLTFNNNGAGAVIDHGIMLSTRLLTSSVGDKGTIINAPITLADNLTINMNSNHSYRWLRFDQDITEDATPRTLTVAGPTYSQNVWNSRRSSVRFAIDNLNVSNFVINGGSVELQTAPTYGMTFANDVTLNGGWLTVRNGGLLYMNSGKSLNLNGGRLQLDNGGGITLDTVQGTLAVNNTTITGAGGISFDAYASGKVLQLLNGSNLRLNDSSTNASVIHVDGTSNLSGTKDKLTALTYGSTITLDNRAMISHPGPMVYADGSASPSGILTSGKQFIYGASGNIEGDDYDGAPDSINRETTSYAPWTLNVGSTSGGVWYGIGADTSVGYGKSLALQFGCPTDVNGNGSDVISVSGNTEIRTTDHIVRESSYNLITQGMMEVGAKITGNIGAGSNTYNIEVNGPGVVRISNKTNDIEGTWRVDRGALVPYIFGDGTQATLGNANNDIVLTNGGTLGFATTAGVTATALDAGRSITVGTGGGRIYLTPYNCQWQSPGTDNMNMLSDQSAINASGLYEPTWSNTYVPHAASIADEAGLGTLNMSGNGQLLGSGTLTKDGHGTLNIMGQNTGFSGALKVVQGIAYAHQTTSVGSTSPNVIVENGGVFAIGFAPTTATFTNVSGDGTFAIGGSYSSNINLTGKQLWLHTTKGAVDNVRVSNITPGPSGYKFGGAGGVLFVDQALSGSLTTKGPGITILTANNSGLTTIDFSRGGLGIGHLNAIGTGKTVDLLVGQQLIFATPSGGTEPLDANSTGKGYTINQKGGSVGFAGDKTISNLNQLGQMVNAGYQPIGIGATGDYGTVTLTASIANFISGKPTLVAKYGESVLDLRTTPSYAPYLGTDMYDGTVRINGNGQLGPNTATNIITMRAGLAPVLEVVDNNVTLATAVLISDSSSSPVGRALGQEPTFSVAAGLTATISNISVNTNGTRMRKIGAGNLDLTFSGVKGPTSGYGLNVEEGTVRVNYMPYNTASTNGTAIFNGGKLVAAPLPGGSTLRDSVDYGFRGFVSVEGTSTTLAPEAGGVIKTTHRFHNPWNKWNGQLVIEGANGTSPTSADWGEVYFEQINHSDGLTVGSNASMIVKSGKMSFGAYSTYPQTSTFALTLQGGLTTIGGNQSINGPVTFAGAVGAPAQINSTAQLAGNTAITWNGEAKVPAAGTLVFNRGASTPVAVAAGSKLTIDATGKVEARGAANPFTSGTAHVDIVNAGTLQVYDASKRVGNVSGAGTTIVEPAITLTATKLVQGTLQLKDGAALAMKGRLQTSKVDTLTLGTGAQLQFAQAGTAIELLDIYANVVAMKTAGTLVDTTGQAGLAIGISDLGTGYIKSMLTYGGDANFDGRVSGGDASILLSNWGLLSGATWGMGDFNGDEKVSGGDASVLLSNWNKDIAALPVLPGSMVVTPEPATLALLGFGGLLALRRRRMQ